MATSTMLRAGTTVALCTLAAACAPVAYDTYGSTYGSPAAVYDPYAPTAAKQVYRTVDGRVFSTAAERSAYLRRHAAYEQELYELERARQELQAGSLSAQQRARRRARVERLERQERLAEQDRRAAERAERQARRDARRIDEDEHLRAQRRNERQADRLARQRADAGQRNAELAAELAAERARRAERRAAQAAVERARIDPLGRTGDVFQNDARASERSQRRETAQRQARIEELQRRSTMDRPRTLRCWS